MGRGDIKKQTLEFRIKLNQDQHKDCKILASSFKLPWQKILSDELIIVSFLHLLISSNPMKSRSSVGVPTFDQKNFSRMATFLYLS